MKVLVCGGRDYEDRANVYNALDKLSLDRPITQIIHGNARGADQLAATWAQVRDISVLSFPAEWLKYKRSAGPVRNRRMLEQGKPDVVVAFPGGRGTAHMVEIARDAGVHVIEVPPWASTGAS